jgi:hypothetical protein
MSDLVKERLGTTFYLGQGIKLYFCGCLCSLLVHDEPTDELTQLRRLVQGASPAEITLWKPYYHDDCNMTWKNFETIGCDWKDAVLIIPNLVPGQLEFCSHASTTVIVDTPHPPNLQSFNNIDEDDEVFLPRDIGSFLAIRLSGHDPHCTETRLVVQLFPAYLRVHSWDCFWAPNGPEGEAVYKEEVIHGLMEAIISEALRNLGEKGYSDAISRTVPTELGMRLCQGE